MDGTGPIFEMVDVDDLAVLQSVDINGVNLKAFLALGGYAHEQAVGGSTGNGSDDSLVPF